QAAKEQAKGVEEVVKGIGNAREQVRQITVAVKEQAKNVDDVLGNMRNVTEEASQVTKATKLQTGEVEQLHKVISEFAEVVNLRCREMERIVSISKEIITYVDEIKEALAEFER
ncbi:methyl-accepting chemotaxis protein, partial [Lutispora thermophila DSM 19022]